MGAVRAALFISFTPEEFSLLAQGGSLMALTLTPNGVTGCSHGCKPTVTRSHTEKPCKGDMCFNAGQNLGKSHAAPLGALYSTYTKSPGSRLGLHHVATIVAEKF